jgi:hypothetical protein
VNIDQSFVYFDERKGEDDMFQVNEDLSIYVTRGDMVYLRITAENDGAAYTFEPGEVLRFKVFGKKDAESVVLQKDFPVTESTSFVDIILDGEDTKIGEVISKPRDYWYEVELNPFDEPMTIIGYDEDGAKVLKLFPEGADIGEYIPTEDDIPFVDDEFDMTSPRPIQNQVVARAFANLQAGYQATHDAVAALHVTPQMFGAVGDGVADDTDALLRCLEQSDYIFIPDGTYLISDTISLTRAEQRLIGGSMGVKIVASDDMSAPMLIMSGANSSQYRSNQQVSNITFKGNGICTGIRADFNASFTLDRVVIKNCGIGFESADALIYNVNECSFANCTKGIVFRAGVKFSPANNVKFSSCRIYECAEYAIMSEDGGSTHGVVFDGCEIEANNINSVAECSILLQSTFRSGNCPMVSFLNCWFENNRGAESVIKISNSHTNHPVVIFTGNVMLNESNTVPIFIDANGVCLYVAFNHNPSEYSDIAINLVNAPYYNFGCAMKHRTDETKFAFVLGNEGKVTTDFTIVNGKAVILISPNGTGYNKVYSTSNHLKMESEKGKVSLNGAMGVDTNNSYEKPLIIGGVYLWANGRDIRVKYGTVPDAADDGNLLITADY